MPNPTPPQTWPAGWYDDGSGRQRWFDGARWTTQCQPAQAAPPVQQQAQYRTGRDRSQYVRQQTGHSLTKHLLLGWVVFYIPTIYYAVSPNHYFHA